MKVQTPVQSYLCLCVLYCLPAFVVCPNHEVVVLQPQTGNNRGLCYITYCYVSNYLSRPSPSAPHDAQFPSEGASKSCHLYPIVAAPQASSPQSYTQDHLPTRDSPVSVSAYQNISHSAGYSAHSVLSGMIYDIMYANCPIIWLSWIQK